MNKKQTTSIPGIYHYYLRASSLAMYATVSMWDFKDIKKNFLSRLTMFMMLDLLDPLRAITTISIDLLFNQSMEYLLGKAPWTMLDDHFQAARP
ncbi:CLUMA_CG014579, isoform A [Clunio marinus]|uniref:CLUMA_CG014579, isoform A n=1 Tax=Clunio marinus TaxID=568069 RepID=A0A1J1IMI4_9DIPT|nr:CLUMA_CG014579, isoform A [Clunio marinus]